MGQPDDRDGGLDDCDGGLGRKEGEGGGEEEEECGGGSGGEGRRHKCGIAGENRPSGAKTQKLVIYTML